MVGTPVWGQGTSKDRGGQLDTAVVAPHSGARKIAKSTKALIKVAIVLRLGT